ncbi:NAD(P)/FAD-dependent oxidoreductase [Tateyamaria sp. ANG-S1]|uniref:flavin monoamine oxidase family protein n=1 Tax=Tateyamaria sp. ANG-S1 TaxID=1577905 RepID=UPI00057D824B|nr:NAD(P)/FAD-dependent oxidoreductase [Tateyamaria sp. ANG-S1]KIC51325.1 hypothetical protein RA29_05735 [Tateyamaria sp. ANG-S1]
MTHDVKVVVVGGGAAGLAAAAELERLGVSCQVLEAQSRLGGRVHTCARDGDTLFERGAQTINGDMSAVLELAEEAGLHVSPIPATGKDLCLVNGEVLPRDEYVSAHEVEELLYDAIRSWSSPGDAVRSFRSLFHWWTSPWDDFGEARRGLQFVTTRDAPPKGSLGAAIRQLLLHPEEEALIRTMFAEQFGANPDIINGVAVRRLFDAYASDRGELEFQFPAGMSSIISGLAAKLSQRPELNTAITGISAEGNGLYITTKDRQWRAARAIVAVPPSVAQHVAIDVGDDDRLVRLLLAFAPGDIIKSTLVYDRPFWRSKGLSGSITFDAPMGLEVRDTSYETGGVSQLTAFLGGPEARYRANFCKGKREDLLLQDLSAVLGKAASRPIEVHEAVWVDEKWSGGGYNGYIRNGHPSDAARQLADWQGLVKFAGAELDDTFAGHVEGAIRSGRKAAAAVAADLGMIQS